MHVLAKCQDASVTGSLGWSGILVCHRLTGYASPECVHWRSGLQLGVVGLVLLLAGLIWVWARWDRGPVAWLVRRLRDRAR